MSKDAEGRYKVRIPESNWKCGFLSYRPHQDISTIVQWLKGISSRVLLQEFPHLRKVFWGRHFWARGYLAVSSGTLTDEMVRQYIEEQEGEPLHDDSQFPIDSP